MQHVVLLILIFVRTQPTVIEINKQAQSHWMRLWTTTEILISSYWQFDTDTPASMYMFLFVSVALYSHRWHLSHTYLDAVSGRASSD